MKKALQNGLDTWQKAVPMYAEFDYILINCIKYVHVLIFIFPSNEVDYKIIIYWVERWLKSLATTKNQYQTKNGYK